MSFEVKDLLNIPFAIYFEDMVDDKLVALHKEVTRLMTARGLLTKPVVEIALDDAEKALTETGRKIAAIKLLRSRLNLGLREAKDAVDAYQAKPDSEPSF